MRTLKSINDEILYVLHVEKVNLVQVAPFNEPVIAEFEDAPDAELGWADPLKGVGIYLAVGHETIKDPHELVRTQEVIKKLLRAYADPTDKYIISFRDYLDVDKDGATVTCWISSGAYAPAIIHTPNIPD